MFSANAVQSSEHKQGYIYTLADPNTGLVRYVGQTVDPKKRYNLHLFHSKTGKARTHKEKWINTLLHSGGRPEMIIVWQGNSTLLDQKEIETISLYKFFGAPLTNATDGGLTTRGRKCSEETKQKFREMFTGKCLRPPITDAERAAISMRSKGRKMPESAKQKLSDDRRGKPSHWSDNQMPQEVKDRWHAAALALSKKVIATKDNQSTEYPSIKAAARELSCAKGDISKVLQGKRHTCAGYSFKLVQQ